MRNYILSETYYWATEFNLDINVVFNDKYTKLEACMIYPNTIIFCTKAVKRKDIIEDILHELGHVLIGNTGVNAINEYYAEKFCLLVLKECYPLNYKRRVKQYKKADFNKWKGCYTPHKIAFKKIKEYN